MRPGTVAVLQALRQRGYEGRIVGGTVRDALIGRAISDIDIATTALPDETIAAALAAGLKWAETGREHGTITVIADHVGHEVTTLRRDLATDGRRAVVAFTQEWREDAQRRDFTINALSCDAEGTVYDYCGGMADLGIRRVRFIGDAAQRIHEDYLRILRFFRFSADLAGGALDPDGLAACDAGRDGLKRLSAERVRTEFLKLLVADAVLPVLESMQAHGYVSPLLGLAPNLLTLRRLIEIEAAVDHKRDARLRLAALGLLVREDAARLGERFRLSNADTTLLGRIVPAQGGSNLVGDERQWRVALYRLGPDVFCAATLLGWVNSGDATSDAAWRQRYCLPGRWVAPKFPVGGDDLAALGVPSGFGMGRLLTGLEDWWVGRDFAPAKAVILDEAKRRLALG